MITAFNSQHSFSFVHICANISDNKAIHYLKDTKIKHIFFISDRGKCNMGSI